MGRTVPKKNYGINYYNYPTYGFGVYSCAIGNPDLLGSPNAILGFISMHIGKPDKHVFDIEPSLGISYDLKPHDHETNPLIDAIGSSARVYFDLNFGGVLWLNPEMDFTYGFGLSHFSKGHTYTPNHGLNMAGFNVGSRYHLSKAQNIIANRFIPERILPSRPSELPVLHDTLVKRHSVNLFVSAGTTETSDLNDRFFISIMTAEYAFKHTLRQSYSLGFDVMYDGNLEGNYPETNDRYLMGIYPGYDFSFWKLEPRAHVGFYLSNSRGKGTFCLRPVLSCRFNKKILLWLALKPRMGPQQTG